MKTNPETMETNMRPFLKANVIIRGKIKCVTGLHIGGSKDKLEIGGVDAPVLRDPVTEQPYIPGSSLKGRMRALLEYATGSINVGPQENMPKEDKKKAGKPGEVSKSPIITQLFGMSAGDDEFKDKEKYEDILKAHTGPTPLLVRDCMPDDATVKMWKELTSDLLYTEYKPENTINRLTSAANPRFLERIVAGSVFDLEIVYSVYDLQTEEDYTKRVKRDLRHLLQGLRLIEDHALGKSGSRGYGRVQFMLMKPVTVPIKEYAEPGENYKNSKSKIDEDTPLLTLADIDSIEFNL